MLVDKAHKAACTIATVFDLAAIGIKNPVAKISLGMARRIDQQYLVTANSKLTVRKCTRTLRGQLNGLTNAIQHDKVVACAMHFCEVPDHADIIANLQPAKYKFLYETVNKAWSDRLGVF